MDIETETTLTDKVFEVAFSFRETAKGVAVGTSVEHVMEGLTTRYSHFPEFRIENVKELDVSLEEAILQNTEENSPDDTSDNPLPLTNKGA